MTITVRNTRPSIYGICIVCSLLLGFLFAYLIMRKNKVPKNIAFYSVLLNFFMALFGGVYYSATESYIRVGEFKYGLAGLGGVLGVLAGALIMCKIVPECKEGILRGFIIALPIMYSIGKLGCFSSGCCGGIAYNGPLAVTYIGTFDYLQDYSVFPVQLTESAVFFIIFLINYIKEYGKESDLTVVLLEMAAAKFLLDFLREAHDHFCITGNQWGCVILAATFVIIKVVISTRKSHEDISNLNCEGK